MDLHGLTQTYTGREKFSFGQLTAKGAGSIGK